MTSVDWFKMWYEDKQSILDCMVHNLADDLRAGYDYYGKSATTQRAEIEGYKAQMDYEFEYLKTLDEKKANHWCYVDMVKRGAITP